MKKEIDPDWYDYMEMNGCKGMWPAAYYGDGLHFWPCGEIQSKTCKCELCKDIAKDREMLEIFG
jgi:hypothetical protein